MDKSCRVSVELEAEQQRIDAADALGTKVDELAKDILSDVESGSPANANFQNWVDSAIDDVVDDSDKLRELLAFLYMPARWLDIAGSSHEVALERLARMRAVFADHQEKWAEREAKQQLEDV